MAEHGSARQLEVLESGPLVTVQDLGRPRHAHLGVPRSGALDLPAHRLANRLVGNTEAAATLECLGGGLSLTTRTALTVAVTGAQVPVLVDGRAASWGTAVVLRAGARLDLGVPTLGLRAYVAVAGGIAVEPVLGSRSTDLLSGTGPRPVVAGTVLPVGSRQSEPVSVDATPQRGFSGVLRLRLGPRADWFTEESIAAISGAAYAVGSASNRIGLRLEGRPLARRADGELPSEGMVLGAVQVPPSGQPVVFLADHPTTGGYPVLGVVLAEDVPACAQLRPGEQVTLRVV